MESEDTINSRTAWLNPEIRVLSQPSGRSGEKFDLPTEAGRSIVIGRGAVDLALADEAVSRRHLRIEFIGTEHHVEDAGSTGGTQLNGRPLLGRQPLRHLDRILIGRSELEYYEPQKALHEEMLRQRPSNPAESDQVTGQPSGQPSGQPMGALRRQDPRPAVTGGDYRTRKVRSKLDEHTGPAEVGRKVLESPEASRQGEPAVAKSDPTPIGLDIWCRWGAVGFVATAATLLVWVLIDTLG